MHSMSCFSCSPTPNPQLPVREAQHVAGPCVLSGRSCTGLSHITFATTHTAHHLAGLLVQHMTQEQAVRRIHKPVDRSGIDWCPCTSCGWLNPPPSRSACPGAHGQAMGVDLLCSGSFTCTAALAAADAPPLTHALQAVSDAQHPHLPAAPATKEAQHISGPPELLSPVQRRQQCHLARRLDLTHQVAVHMLLEGGTPSRLQLPRACHKLVQKAEVAEVGLALHLHGRESGKSSGSRLLLELQAEQCS